MGLAASQSRFLLLTARGNSLNSRMLSLQNQNMAMQRQSAILSQEYNKKQNAQIVKYNDAELNYASLMQPNPSGYNHMITDSSGAVVLTGAMATKLGLGGRGDAHAFEKVGPSSATELMQRLTGATPDENSTATSSKNSYDSSAYKYDDSIMNKAVVNVQAATPLAISGYLFDEEGNVNQNAQMEYAMGIQQNSMGGTGGAKNGITSLACIYTMDKSQFHQPTIQAVTNEFVAGATTAMSNVMAGALGSTDAVAKSLDYATKMTQLKYAKSEVNIEGLTIDRILYNATSGSKKSEDEYNSTGILVSNQKYSVTTTTDVQQIRNKDGEKMYKKSQSDPNDKDHMKPASEKGSDYIYPCEEVAMTIDEYEGHDVFVNTSQLTATFLNYFDIGMMMQLGTAESKAFAEYLEGKMNADDATDMISLRNEIKKCGLDYYDANQASDDRNILISDTNYANYPINKNVVSKWADSLKNVTLTSGQNYDYRWISVADDAPSTFTVQVASGKDDGSTYTVTFEKQSNQPEGAEKNKGNVYYKISVAGMPYGTGVNESVKVNYVAKSEKGTNVIGSFGNQELLSNTFDIGATGAFGSKNLAGNDYKNFTSSYKTSSGVVKTSTGQKATGDNSEYSVAYYTSLFNAMAAGGWVVDGQVNNASYLSQQMLQGNLVLQQFNNSQSWAVLQLGDSNNGLDTVKDQDTIDKAKSEYESKSAIMKTKQTFIENEIESLKTQTEAIDKEKESLESIMEKEQEKLKIFTG